jgi:glycosyl transferase family 25
MNNQNLPQKFELYVINLDRSLERWQRIKPHLENMGLAPVRISAVDAINSSADVLSAHYSLAVNQHTFFMPLKPAEIGCFLSHRKALETFLTTSDKPYAIILEDDVEFVHNISQYIQQWEDALAGDAPVMLKLFKRRPISGVCVTNNEQTQLIKPKLVPLGTQAQVVNRSAAKALLAAFSQFGMPVDVAYQHFWQHGVDVLITVPNQVNEISQIVGGTNIGGSKGLSFSYKVKREIKRSWFRLKLKLKSGFHFAKTKPTAQKEQAG